MCAEKSFLFNSVLMKLVPYKGQDTHPNGVAFYVNNGQGGVIGVRVYPDGQRTIVTTSTNRSDGTKTQYKRESSQRYIVFTHAWGYDIPISASHAVYTAWREKPIPAGMTIDHIDGCSTNNYIGNLRCVSDAINHRDGGFLTKLRHMGFYTSRIERAILLRYYDRMAYIKEHITSDRYNRLTKEQLRSILFLPDEELKINALIQTLKSKRRVHKTK